MVAQCHTVVTSRIHQFDDVCALAVGSQGNALGGVARVDQQGVRRVGLDVFQYIHTDLCERPVLRISAVHFSVDVVGMIDRHGCGTRSKSGRTTKCTEY